MFVHINKSHVPADSTWHIVFTTESDSNLVYVTSNRQSPYDLSQTYGPQNWNGLNPLWKQYLRTEYLNHDLRVMGWNATEYLKFFEHEYLAGYNAAMLNGVITNPDSNGIWIVQLGGWNAAAQNYPEKFFLGAAVTAVDEELGKSRATRASLRVLNLGWGRGDVEVLLDLPVATIARVEVFDVQGRRVRGILDRQMPAGRTRLTWDGKTANGVRVGTGMYFARLTSREGDGLARLPVVR